METMSKKQPGNFAITKEKQSRYIECKWTDDHGQ